MFYLVETPNQFEGLKNMGYKEAFVEVIPFNNVLHPCQNNVSAVYYRPLFATKGYILPITHSETLSLNIRDVNQYLSQHDKLYVRDKKEFLHYFVLHNTYDITLNLPSYNAESLPIYSVFYRKHKNLHNINCIIPITKHYEYCEKIFFDLKDRINDPINDFFNTRASVVFNAIERGGLRIDREKFEQKFHPTDSTTVYTQYNFKTTTGRPSNRFRGVNYAALNKENGDRECFIASNDLLVELDISAYHPTLLAKLIGYEFDTEDIHQAFAEMYGVDYKKAKELTFKQLYGGIFPQYKHLEFFQKAQSYIDGLWDIYQNDGYVECSISKRRFERDKLDNMNPQKLLNYIIQSLETSTNVVLLWKIFNVLKECNTKIILYTFDSILLDYDSNEKDQLEQIISIFNNAGLQVKGKKGINYQFDMAS